MKLIPNIPLALRFARTLNVESRNLPVFPINGRDVKILKEPEDFYNQLITNITNAKSRVLLASLYLGTGKKEAMIIELLKQKMENNKDFKVEILLDGLRGTRISRLKDTGETVSSARILSPLKTLFPSQFNAYFYQTPRLTKFLKWILPQRVNEVIGVQHIKAYIFDNDIIISGANLSDDYFTNRQDRYMLIKENEKETGITNYFVQLIRTISTFSYHLSTNPTPNSTSPEITLSMKSGIPDPSLHSKQFSQFANQQLTHFIDSSPTFASHIERNHQNEVDECDTFFIPTIQCGVLNISNDEKYFLALLKSFEEKGRLYLSTAYFNIAQHFLTSIIHNENQPRWDIMTSSIKMNGFFGAKGLSGYIPFAYLLQLRNFLTRSHRYNKNIHLWEYYREKWTFHAKGLWYYAPSTFDNDINSDNNHSSDAQSVTLSAQLPSFSIVGSSNFGLRSLKLDLEAQVMVFTQNSDLQSQLHNEKEELFAKSEEITLNDFKSEEKKIPTILKFIPSSLLQLFL